MFEACFCLKASSSLQGKDTSVTQVWQYPLNQEAIAKPVRDVREFAFADLEQLRLEAHPDESQSETFSFVVGREFHGICLRAVNRGECGFYGIGRRMQQCLVIVSRYPFHEFFHGILHQLRGMSLLSRHISGDGRAPESIRMMLEEMYELGRSTIRVNGTALKLNSVRLKFPEYVDRGLREDKRPPPASHSILLLLEVLGLEQFMYLLSALLLERRVIVTADNVSRLSSAVLACVDMLFPFKWQHVYIPFLPASRVGYLNAPMPFVIGVKRYLLNNMDNTFMDEVVILDVDDGTLQTLGEVDVLELIGDSGTTLRQASEGIAQLKNKVTRGFASLGLKVVEEDKFPTSSSFQQAPSTGPVRKDIVTAMFNELRPLLASKPVDGTNVDILQSDGLREAIGSRIGLRKLSLASRAVFPLIGKVGSSFEDIESVQKCEDILSWRARGEKCVRNNLLLFFLYLFADLDEFFLIPSSETSLEKTYCKDGHRLARRASSSGMKQFFDTIDKLANGNAFGEGDSRASFDLSAFLLKKSSSAVGLSNELLLFLKDFIHSQLFEQYCGVRKRILIAKLQQSSDKSDEAVLTIYDKAVTRLGGSPITISGIKESLASLAASHLANCHYGGLGTGGHPLVVQFAEKSGEVPRLEVTKAGITYHLLQKPTGESLNRDLGLERIHPSLLAMQLPPAADFLSDMTLFQEDQYLHSMNEEHCMLYELCDDARNMGSDCGFSSIIFAIEVKLVECLGSGLRGVQGRAGARALVCLQALLIHGPEAVLSISLDLIPLLRALCTGKVSPNSCISKIAAFDFADDGLCAENTGRDAHSFGGASDKVKVEAAAVLCLLLDQSSLGTQRDVSSLRRSTLAALSQKSSLESCFAAPWNGYGRYFKEGDRVEEGSPIGPFSNLHALLRPEALPATKPCSLILRRQSTGDTKKDNEEEEDEDDEEDGDVQGASYTILAEAAFSSHGEYTKGQMTTKKSLTLSAIDGINAAITPSVSVLSDSNDDVRVIEAKMTAIYKIHFPEKVGNVPILLAKYKGREYEMLEKLEARYGTAPRDAFLMTSPSTGDNTGGNSRTLSAAATAASTHLSSLVTDVSSASLALVANVGRRGSGNTEFGDMIRRRSSGGGTSLLANSNADPNAETVLQREKMDLELIEIKMTALYRKHQPTKVGDVKQLLLKYKGKEKEMLAKLEERFGSAPSVPTEPSNSMALSSESTESVSTQSALFIPSESVPSSSHVNCRTEAASTNKSMSKVVNHLVDLSDLRGAARNGPTLQKSVDPFASLGFQTISPKKKS